MLCGSALVSPLRPVVERLAGDAVRVIDTEEAVARQGCSGAQSASSGRAQNREWYGMLYYKR